MALHSYTRSPAWGQRWRAHASSTWKRSVYSCGFMPELCVSPAPRGKALGFRDRELH